MLNYIISLQDWRGQTSAIFDQFIGRMPFAASLNSLTYTEDVSLF